MLPAQLANVADAALGLSPPTHEFLARLRQWSNPIKNNADEALFGNTFSKGPAMPRGSENNKKVAIRAVEDFELVCQKKNVVLDDLDAWMTAFSKWVLGMNFLLDGEDAQKLAMEQRQALSNDAGVVLRDWSPLTLKTMVNALATIHRSTRPPVGIVPSSTKQFPTFCALFNDALRRCKDTKCLEEAVEVLQDEEIVKLYDATNWVNLLEAQRMNLLILAFQLGQRPDTLINLKVGSVHFSKAEDGEEMLEVVIGTMKNKPAKQQTASSPLHRQLIFKHQDTKLCGVAAYNRQVKLLGSHKPEDYLFRGIKNLSKAIPQGPPSYSSCRGAAKWAGDLLGRPLTFKDCARRPVFTKLANSLSSYDAAKAMGVKPQTLANYHRASSSSVNHQAANVLRQV